MHENRKEFEKEFEEFEKIAEDLEKLRKKSNQEEEIVESKPKLKIYRQRRTKKKFVTSIAGIELFPRNFYFF